MGEIIRTVNVAEDLPAVRWRSAGVVYEPNPAPTATLILPDGTAADPAPTLTKQGEDTTARYLIENFTHGNAEQLEIIYATTDTDADIAEFVEYVTVNPASAGTVDANVVSWKGDVPADLSGDKVNSTLGTELDAKIGSIGTASALALSPVINENTLRIVRGDSYQAADGRAIDIPYSGQPDFTSATDVLFRAVRSNKEINDTLTEWTGSVVNATTLRFTPTTTDTDDFPALRQTTQANYPFEVSLTLANGNPITPTSLHAGRIYVDQQASAES